MGIFVLCLKNVTGVPGLVCWGFCVCRVGLSQTRGSRVFRFCLPFCPSTPSLPVDTRPTVHSPPVSGPDIRLPIPSDPLQRAGGRRGRGVPLLQVQGARDVQVLDVSLAHLSASAEEIWGPRVFGVPGVPSRSMSRSLLLVDPVSTIFPAFKILDFINFSYSTVLLFFPTSLPIQHTDINISFLLFVIVIIVFRNTGSSSLY